MKAKFHIIGGGIAGLTTALCLQQKGFEVCVYERATEIKPVGAGIILAINATQVFEKLGIYERLLQRGHLLRQMFVTDAQFKLLSGGDLGNFEKKYQVATIAIHRGDLQQILAEAVGLQNIQLGKRLSYINKNNNSYLLEFEDLKKVEARYVIGADGIHSVVRNQLFHESTLRNAGQLCWRGIADLNLPDKYRFKAYETWGKGKRFGFVWVNERKVYWFALINHAPIPPKNFDLLEIFKEFHPDVLHILAKTPVQQIIMGDILDLKPISTWCQENLCLVGDAAHATTPNLGQGACQAIEDAHALANLLEKQSNINTAFQQYQDKRFEKANYITQMSWQIGKIAQLDNPFALWLRNSFMRLLPASSNQRMLERIFQL